MLLPGASAGARSEATATAAPLIRIGGPAKLKVRKVLKFPIFCSHPCFATVTTKLILPGPNLHTTVSGSVGRRTAIKLRLNGTLRDYLKDHYRQSRLKVIARARNLDTNAHATARRTFRFHL
jgi:hypothetical protein